MTEHDWREIPCPLCGSPARWSGELLHCSAPSLADCPAGGGNVLDRAQILAELDDGQLAWWRSLPDFFRAVLSEPQTEAAIARIARPLLRLGADADVVQAVARAANSLRGRPATSGAVDEVVLRVARQIAEERRRGAAA